MNHRTRFTLYLGKGTYTITLPITQFLINSEKKAKGKEL